MDEHDYADEFTGEYPAYAVETRELPPGTRIEVAGAYACSTCPETPDRTYQELHAGEVLGECPGCGAETRWQQA